MNVRERVRQIVVGLVAFGSILHAQAANCEDPRPDGYSNHLTLRKMVPTNITVRNTSWTDVFGKEFDGYVFNLADETVVVERINGKLIVDGQDYTTLLDREKGVLKAVANDPNLERIRIRRGEKREFHYSKVWIESIDATKQITVPLVALKLTIMERNELLAAQFELDRQRNLSNKLQLESILERR